MDYKLILDLIVAVLLATTITYAVILNNRLNQLRKNRDELAKMVASFNDATARAEAGIPKLKRASEEASATLLDRVEKAQTLRDDLAFMIERADAMANRLEGSVRAARTESKPSPAPASSSARPSMVRPSPQPGPAPSMGTAPSPMTAGGENDDDDERSEAERELLRALQAVR